MSDNSKQLSKVQEAIDWCRAQTLDNCEVELGDAKRWVFLRSRLLRIFGHRGLEGKLMEILSSDSKLGGDHE